MLDLADFKNSAFELLDRYTGHFTGEDYTQLKSHSGAQNHLINRADFFRILKNLSHYYQAASIEILSENMEKIYSLCSSKKVQHCIRNSPKLDVIFDYLIGVLKNGDTDLSKITPEIEEHLKTLKELEIIRDDNELEKAGAEREFQCSFKIHIRPSEAVFTRGLDVITILQELSRLGEAALTPLTETVPDLDSIDPEKCYVGWNILLNTDADLNAVKDILIFMDYDSGCELTIEQTKKPETKKTVIPEKAPAPIETKPAVKIQKPASEETVVHKEDYLSTIRVPAERLDKIVNLVGEMVTAQSKLTRLAASYKMVDLSSVAEELERLTDELRSGSMGLRMLPVSVLFKRFTRLVHDLSKDLNKKVELVFEGEETEIDKTVIEKIYDPILHLIRNSIDHGIELPSERASNGKPEEGKLILSAMQSGPEVHIQVRDDGAGVRLDKVRAKAIEKEIIKETDSLTEKQLLHLLFAPGFSTANEVSSVSGRGVGMDVVKSNVESLRGSVDISSEAGKGTSVTLRFPLTLAIIDGLIVKLQDELFVLPLSSVEECIDFKQENTGQESRMIHLRGSAVPFIRLREFFEMPVSESRNEIMVVIRDEAESRIGLIVDSIVSQHQTVIKPLGSLHQDRMEFSGATILGDGSVALIIDTVRLINSAVRERP